MEMYAVCLSVCAFPNKLNTHRSPASLEYVFICGAFHSLAVFHYISILTLTPQPCFSFALLLHLLFCFLFMPHFYLFPVSSHRTSLVNLPDWPTKRWLALIHSRVKSCLYLCVSDVVQGREQQITTYWPRDSSA